MQMCKWIFMMKPAKKYGGPSGSKTRHFTKQQILTNWFSEMLMLVCIAKVFFLFSEISWCFFVKCFLKYSCVLTPRATVRNPVKTTEQRK